MKFFFFVFLFFAPQTRATEIFEYNQSIRSLGMGGVRVWSDTDTSVLYWNSAALTKIRGINWTVFNLGLGVNGVNTYNNFVKNSNAINGLNSLSSYYGQDVWLGASGNTTFAFPYFGFGLYDSGFLDFRLDNPAFPQLTLNAFNDYGFSTGVGIPMGPAASLGLTAKRMTRRGGTVILGPDFLSSVSNSTLQNAILDEGVGYGMDVSMMYAPPTAMNPSVYFSWLDVGSTAFVQTKGSQAPPRIKDNLVFGVNTHGSSWGFGYAAGLEYRHITDTGEALGKKLHLGLEMSMPLLDVRGGFYQGYATYGAGIDLWIMQLDAAVYYVEKGFYPGQTPDQRVQISLTMELSFDPSFKFIEGGGKKRRLKQRR